MSLLFAAAAIAVGILTSLGKGLEGLIASGTYDLGREQIQAMHIYVTKMAGVFMISTSTISLQTRIVPRWMAFLGYALAAILLLSIEGIVWIALAFPVWVFLFSLCILIENPGRGERAAEAAA